MPTAGNGAISLTWNILSVTLTNPGAQTSTAGETVTPLALSATDSQSLALTYAAAGLPAGINVNTITGVISGAAMGPGSYTATVSATDTAGATASQTFIWTVNSQPAPGCAWGSDGGWSVMVRRR